MDRTHLLNKLWEYQHQFRFISKEAVSEISKKLNVSNLVELIDHGRQKK